MVPDFKWKPHFNEVGRGWSISGLFHFANAIGRSPSGAHLQSGKQVANAFVFLEAVGPQETDMQEGSRADQDLWEHYPTWPSSPLRRANVSQSGVLTAERIAKLIQAGYGQGHGPQYRPWLRVQKRDYSPFSSVGHLSSPLFGRLHHYRSRIERDALVLLQWLAACDARDQYPMWPWPHRHPAYGLPGWDTLTEVPGLDQIADEAGIVLKATIGSAVRSIATLDILSTWKDGRGYFLVAHSCKPIEAMKGPMAWRALEQLELTRRYALRCGVVHQVVSSFDSHRTLLINLDVLRPQVGWPMIQKTRSGPQYKKAIEAFQNWGYRRSMREVTDRTAGQLRVPQRTVYDFLQMALWLQDVDHDLSIPLETWRPLVRGGLSLRSSLREQWAVRL